MRYSIVPGAEAARAATGRGEIDILFDNVCTSESPGLKLSQKPDEIAGGEVHRIAKPACTILFSEFMSCAIGFRKGLATITGARKQSSDQPLVLPRKAAEQNRYIAALCFEEGEFLRIQP